ncbi:MAG: tetratricopeptide repeat protein [Acidobacteriota bacterium]
MALDVHRQRRIQTIFDAASELSGRERSSYLDDACDDDSSLRSEVEDLLSRMETPTRELQPLAVLDQPDETIVLDGLRERGRYVPLDELGRGGGGVVYRARDERLGRQVALKILTSSLTGDSQREAGALSQLSHPQVATLHDLLEIEGASVLVLELLSGSTLSRALSMGALGWTETVHLGVEIASALEATHAAGVIHRDLKPSNVSLSPSGSVKVFDFGLAAAVAVGRVGECDGASVVIGTPGYMSPEQLRGAGLDERTDVWALGCLLYECLTARPAFSGHESLDEQLSRLEGGPDWSALPEDTPPALSEVIRSCLRVDLERRVSTVHRVREQLEELARPVERFGRSATEQVVPGVPPEHDAFVGRSAELNELARHLDGGVRLVTVTGVAGTGKTRLVQRHGLLRHRDWPGGVHFCDLTEARDREGLLVAVASTFELVLKAGPVEQVGRVLATLPPCLVILDNFEQVAEHAEATVGTWLATADEARFVVTSRRRLGLPEEVVLPLEPLGCEGAAAELFELRASERRPGFTVSDEERPLLLETVTLLDGLPLAIELAAARMAVLSLGGLVDRLQDRFGLLTKAAGATGQSNGLEAAIDWSWELLEPWEKLALAQVSVFEGGFTLESAEGVIELDSIPGSPMTMDVVQALVDKNLVRRLEGRSSEATQREPRFGTYLSIQEYASRKLRDMGETIEAQVMRRHVEHHARHGADAFIEGLVQHGGEERHRRLRLELDNLVVACRRAVSLGEGRLATANLIATWAVLRVPGPHALARRLAADVLALPSLTSRERGRAHECLAGAQLALGDLKEARASCNDAIRDYRECGQRQWEGSALRTLGEACLQENRQAEARQLYEEALELHRSMGDRLREGHALGSLGDLEARSGRLEEARRCLEGALRLNREVGNRRSEAFALGFLAALATVAGRHEDARTGLESALAIARDLGDKGTEGACVHRLGRIHSEQGRWEEARACFESALRLLREVGIRVAELTVLFNLGRVLVSQDRLLLARARFREAGELASELDQKETQGESLAHRGELELRLGDRATAQACLDEASSLAEELGVAGDSDLAQGVSKLRAALSETS